MSRRMAKYRQLTAFSALMLANLAGVALPTTAFADPMPYGPDTCIQGYVWRGANSLDHVCVVPAIHDQTARENALAGQRKNPSGGAYGTDTCLQGYVWREAFEGDHVCVTPDSRTQGATDNANAPWRMVANNPPPAPAPAPAPAPVPAPAPAPAPPVIPPPPPPIVHPI